MAAGIDSGANFLEMFRHGKAVAEGHDQTGTLAFFRADGAEDISPFGALVFRGRRSASPLGPSPRDLVFLTYPGFILPPDFELGSAWKAALDFCQIGGEVFLKASSANAFCPWCFGRADSFR